MKLIYRQEIWVPTAQGWLLLITCVAAVVLFLQTHIYSFLALNRPIKADILVIEGWMQDDGFKEVIREFERGDYQKLITIGPSLHEGYHLSIYKNFAERGAAVLSKLGFDPNKVIAVETPYVHANRTYGSAVALRQWILNSDLKIKSLNLYTFDVHSRRNWLIFNKTFAPEIQVGVIALKPFSYDPQRWWTSSTGVKAVIFETIAYIYAQFVNWKT
ncbi:MAG TPA: cytosine deaminase [Cyanobacteria bacterium UBA8553]|nr:cytosine deaminase [Cyanobacteria bacterium UBA8553]HAJ63675.1 cytosine deaminase [Cyanobacteria bacterium UBA8543]